MKLELYNFFPPLHKPVPLCLTPISGPLYGKSLTPQQGACVLLATKEQRKLLHVKSRRDYAILLHTPFISPISFLGYFEQTRTSRNVTELSNVLTLANSHAVY